MGAKAGALQVNVEHVIPIAFAQFEKRHAREHPSIVDEHVDRAEPLLDRRYHRLDLAEPAQIGAHGQRAPAGGADLIGDALRGGLVVEPVDRDVGSCPGAAQGDGPPDPLLRPGHQNDLAG